MIKKNLKVIIVTVLSYLEAYLKSFWRSSNFFVNSFSFSCWTKTIIFYLFSLRAVQYLRINYCISFWFVSNKSIHTYSQYWVSIKGEITMPDKPELLFRWFLWSSLWSELCSPNFWELCPAWSGVRPSPCSSSWPPSIWKKKFWEGQNLGEDKTKRK